MYNVCVSCANELSSGNTLPGTYAMLNSARLSTFFRGTQEELVAAREQARRPRFARTGGRAPRAALRRPAGASARSRGSASTIARPPGEPSYGSTRWRTRSTSPTAARAPWRGARSHGSSGAICTRARGARTCCSRRSVSGSDAGACGGPLTSSTLDHHSTVPQ